MARRSVALAAVDEQETQDRDQRDRLSAGEVRVGHRIRAERDDARRRRPPVVSPTVLVNR